MIEHRADSRDPFVHMWWRLRRRRSGEAFAIYRPLLADIRQTDTNWVVSLWSLMSLFHAVFHKNTDGTCGSGENIQ